MISVKEAIQTIENTTKHYRYEKVLLGDALHRVLANDVLSPINMPPFRQSAMDGYAIKWSEEATFKLIEESKAGDSLNYKLARGEAVRIFTGALVPDDADTVVIQEHVNRMDDTIIIEKQPKPYANIRNAGEQIQTGQIALKKRTKLNEAAIGFLACLGITEVEVYKPPKTAVLLTGNELQDIGSPLPLGKIYNSNGIMLRAALANLGLKTSEPVKIKDDYEATETIIKHALSDHDVVLISGGISVGDYDFVRQALLANGVEEHFYKVNQKPGKPLWFGQKDNTFVFALPGNPASALTCFYVYVLPLIKNLCGDDNEQLDRVSAKSKSTLKNTSNKTLFLKARLDGDSVELLSGQSSAMLQSFAMSNALVRIDEDMTHINIGDQLECLKLNL